MNDRKLPTNNWMPGVEKVGSMIAVLLTIALLSHAASWYTPESMLFEAIAKLSGAICALVFLLVPLGIWNEIALARNDLQKCAEAMSATRRDIPERRDQWRKS